MTFAVLIRYCKWDKSEPYDTPSKLFLYSRDEGEGLRTLREMLKKLLSEEAKEEYDIIPFGDGVNWEIFKCKRDKKVFIFTMINEFTGEAYRFYLKKMKYKN